MGFTQEERECNLRASRQQLEEDVEAFFQRYASVEAGFDTDDLVAFLRTDRIDRRGAHHILMGLKGEARVRYLAGRWHVDPLPPES